MSAATCGEQQTPDVAALIRATSSAYTIPAGFADRNVRVESNHRSGTHFEDHVEGRLRRAAKSLEARFERDLAQSAFSGLGAETQGHFL
jgi:hypothetical protein